MQLFEEFDVIDHMLININRVM